MIGFYDPHLLQSPKGTLNPPNVDLMKLATYYRNQNVVGRLILPNEPVAPYDKIYCFSEKPCEIPRELKNCDNVIYGGSYFTKGVYVPFEDAAINYTIPKIGIYYEFLKQCGESTKVVNNFLDNTYYRIGHEEIVYPAPVIQKRHKLYIYDKNLIKIPNWCNVLDKLASHKPSTIVAIHPIYCTTIEQFLRLRKIERLSRSENHIIIKLNLTSNDIAPMFKQYLNVLLAELTYSNKVYLQLGGSLATATQYYQNLIYTLNLLYCFWARGVPIKLWFNESDIGYNNPIVELSKMLASWSINTFIEKRTTATAFDSFNKVAPDVRLQQYQNFIAYYPNCKNLFTQSYELLRMRKYWGF